MGILDLPHNLFLYLLLLVAVALGFLLGRRERRKPREVVIRDYYQGLNFLLSDRPELGVDQFIQDAEVSDQTVDVHLAMASVVRRRGEVDKAIRIHQNLLASPVLNAANKQLIELELARDYQMAGLLDRAEGLLQQIVSKGGQQKTAASELLLDLYEQERDWQKAIDVGQRLIRHNEDLKSRIAHFYCELADALLADGDRKPATLKQASQYVRRAIDLAPVEARGHWLLAQIAFHQKRDKQVLRHIHRASQIQKDLVSVFLPLYQRACERLSDEAAFEQFLQQCLARSPDPQVLRAWIRHCHAMGRPVDKDAVLGQISRAPQPAHLPELLTLMDEETHLRDGVLEQINRVVYEEPRFQCKNCGFSGHLLLWHCPTCKTWGSFGQPTTSNR